MTSGEPDHFRKEDPLPPNPSNAEHQEWIKRGQRILVDCYGFLPELGQTWLLPSPQLRHLLQYLNTTKTMGLLYAYPKKPQLTEFIVFGDSSFAPSGKHSQPGFTVHLSYGNCRHLIHWQSLREPKIAESSAETMLSPLPANLHATSDFFLESRSPLEC